MTPYMIFLVAANLLPLAGVVFWGWDAFVILMLYWLETVVIAFWTILPVLVVPGITAAIAASAYAGIPVTHRDLNSSFTFVTGHEKEEAYRASEAGGREPGGWRAGGRGSRSRAVSRS